jgi:hypothetical protein
MTIRAFMLLATLAATPAAAQEVKPSITYAELAALPVPVTNGDISDRPYTVVGPIKAGVRKANLLSKAATPEKVYRELWERGEKMHADAVINAQYGESHIAVTSWGKTNATGMAIKFVTK